MRKSKKVSCFEWMPTAPKLRPNLTPFKGLLPLLLLMGFPAAAAKTIFLTIVNGTTFQNILDCCTGQEAQLLKLLAENCGIFGLTEMPVFLNTNGAVSTNFGKTFEGNDACSLLYRAESWANVKKMSCLEDTLSKAVVSGLSNTCQFRERDFWFIVLGVLITLFLILVLKVACGFSSGRAAHAAVNENEEQILPPSANSRYIALVEKFNSLVRPADASPELVRAFDQLENAFTAFRDRHICVITHEITNDPVVLDCEHSFERRDLQSWLDQCRREEHPGCCPCCKSPINYPIRLNEVRKKEIQQYLDRFAANIKSLEGKLSNDAVVDFSQDQEGVELLLITDEVPDLIEFKP